MNIIETSAFSEQEFINLGLSYGKLISSRKTGELVDILIANEKANVHKDSLSKLFGLDPFPAHTDGAYCKCPPSFILLRYAGCLDNVSPTIVVHFE